MSGFENFAKVTAVVSALGGAAEGVQAQEVVDEGMKNAVIHEMLPVLEEGGMKKIGDGKFTMEHNGVLLEITIPTQRVETDSVPKTSVVDSHDLHSETVINPDGMKIYRVDPEGPKPKTVINPDGMKIYRVDPEGPKESEKFTIELKDQRETVQIKPDTRETIQLNEERVKVGVPEEFKESEKFTIELKDKRVKVDAPKF